MFRTVLGALCCSAVLSYTVEPSRNIDSPKSLSAAERLQQLAALPNPTLSGPVDYQKCNVTEVPCGKLSANSFIMYDKVPMKITSMAPNEYSDRKCISSVGVFNSSVTWKTEAIPEEDCPVPAVSEPKQYMIAHATPSGFVIAPRYCGPKVFVPASEMQPALFAKLQQTWKEDVIQSLETLEVCGRPMLISSLDWHSK